MKNRFYIYLTGLIIGLSFLFLIQCAKKESAQDLEPAELKKYSEVEIEPEGVASEEDLFDQFKPGKVVFNVPKTMELDEKRGIQLLLSLKETFPELKKKIEEAGEIQQQQIRVSQIMTASLKGSGFKIEVISPALQLINIEGTTEWRWEITAIEPGVQKLYLSMDAIFNHNGKDLPYTVETLSEEIEIIVTWQQKVSAFVGENWKWLWTTILVPFLGWIWERRKNKGDKK
jgi:hypothetical protein